MSSSSSTPTNNTRITKELIDEALRLIPGQISGQYPYEPFYLRGSFGILYQASKSPALFTTHIQSQSLQLCDHFIRSGLDLFYAYVFKATILIKYNQYQAAIEALYTASMQFIPRNTMTYSYILDYITIFNTLFTSSETRMINRKFPTLTMASLEGTSHKFSFDITQIRTTLYTIPLEDDQITNLAYLQYIPQSPFENNSPNGGINSNNNNNIGTTPAIGKTPSIHNNTYTNINNTSTNTNTNHIHATPRAKQQSSASFQPVSSKISQSASKTTSGTHSGDHKPNNSLQPEHVPAFALPEADDEEFEFEDDNSALLNSNEDFYNSYSNISKPLKLNESSSTGVSGNSNINTNTSLEYINDDLERMKKELYELEQSHKKMVENSYFRQISAAIGAVGLASLWMVQLHYRTFGTTEDKAITTEETGGGSVVTPPNKDKSIGGSGNVNDVKRSTNDHKKRSKSVRTGTVITWEEDGKEMTQMRPRRHRRTREVAEPM